MCFELSDQKHSGEDVMDAALHCSVANLFVFIQSDFLFAGFFLKKSIVSTDPRCTQLLAHSNK